MADEPTFIYPPLLDPFELARDYSPPATRSGDWFAALQAFLGPFAQIDGEFATFIGGVSVPDLADGDALAALGSRVGEDQGGLTDPEYKRIVLGALAGTWARRSWTDAAAWAMWLALSGSDAADASVTTSGAGYVTFRGLLRFTPSAEWVVRAGRVLRKSVRPGLQWEAFFALSGALIFDDTPGLDTGLLVWYATDEGGA